MKRRILYISPSPDLAGAIRGAETVLAQADHASGLAQALALMRRTAYSAVLTEASLPDGTWRDVLAHARRAGLGCAVVVTDRLADDRLWIEVLEAGAYDLLAQPFDAGEVVRVLDSACVDSSAMPPRRAARELRAAV